MSTEGFPITFLGGIHIESLEAFHDHVLGTAASIVEAGEETTAPVLFVLSNDGKLAVLSGAAFSKDGIASFQRSAVLAPMVRACAVVMEAWTSERKAGDTSPRVLPENDPNRGECIVVSILTARRQALTHSPIKRPENTVTKAKFQWLDEAKGDFAGRFIR